MSESELKTFDAVVEKEGKFTFVAIPFSPREVWGAKPRATMSPERSMICLSAARWAPWNRIIFSVCLQIGEKRAGLNPGTMWWSN